MDSMSFHSISTAQMRKICDTIDEHGYVPEPIREELADETGAPKWMGRTIGTIEGFVYSDK